MMPKLRAFIDHVKSRSEVPTERGRPNKASGISGLHHGCSEAEQARHVFADRQR